MIKWIEKPNLKSVSAFVESYWYLETDSGNSSNLYPKLNPDPSAHLLIASFQDGFRYMTENCVIQGRGAHWLFPQTRTLTLDHSKHTKIVGIRFRVGALYCLPFIHESQLVNQILEVSKNQYSEYCFPEVEKALQLAKTDINRCVVLLDECLKVLLAGLNIDKNALLVKKALKLLPETPINELSDSLHCSHRTLERSFMKVTGLTLKQCKSILKFEALLQHIYTLDKESIDWVGLAYEFGFSDQPHLIRHVKSVIGETPGRYLEKRDLTIDTYGGVEFLSKFN